MNNHNNGHNHGHDVHEVVRRLENKRIGDLNRSRIAFRLDANIVIDFLVAYDCAQRYGCLRT